MGGFPTGDRDSSVTSQRLVANSISFVDYWTKTNVWTKGVRKNKEKRRRRRGKVGEGKKTKVKKSDVFFFDELNPYIFSTGNWLVDIYHVDDRLNKGSEYSG